MGKISLVIPVYNEVAILQQVLDTYLRDLENIGAEYEIVAVNDGSSDGSEDILKSAAKKNRKIRVINLDGRYGKQAAINAGMETADKNSAAVILADVDILNPEGILQHVIEKIQSGEKIVYARRENLGSDSLKAKLSDASVKIGAKIFGIEGKYTGKTNIAAFARCVVNVIIALPERNKFLRTMDTWLGWRICNVKYSGTFTKSEEKNIVQAAREKLASSPRVKSFKPINRDKIREHTASMDLFKGLFIAALIVFITGIAYLGMGGPMWVNLVIWLMFGVLSMLCAVFYLQSVLIKRIGIIYGKYSVAYKIKDVLN
jgi:glycosyltransferase involved in cell wall biosynthesis